MMLVMSSKTILMVKLVLPCHICIGVTSYYKFGILDTDLPIHYAAMMTTEGSLPYPLLSIILSKNCRIPVWANLPSLVNFSVTFLYDSYQFWSKSKYQLSMLDKYVLDFQLRNVTFVRNTVWKAFLSVSYFRVGMGSSSSRTQNRGLGL